MRVMRKRVWGNWNEGFRNLRTNSPLLLRNKRTMIERIDMASNWYKDFMAGAGVQVGSYKPDKPTGYTGLPTDLANMRDNGVRSIAVYCLDCDHRANVNVDQYPAHWAVKSFEGRMVCGACKSRRVHVRPSWSTKATPLPRS